MGRSIKNKDISKAGVTIISPKQYDKGVKSLHLNKRLVVGGVRLFLVAKSVVLVFEVSDQASC